MFACTECGHEVISWADTQLAVYYWARFGQVPYEFCPYCPQCDCEGHGNMIYLGVESV